MGSIIIKSEWNAIGYIECVKEMAEEIEWGGKSHFKESIIE